jgi:GNAT superfamily N-acetyltransferase
MRSFKWTIRLAREADAPTLEKLIPLSVRELQSEYYSAAQMEAAIGSIFGADRQLIRDGTYFVVEYEGEIVGCGGWSRRKKLFGGDAIGIGEDAILDPKWEPARIRAFFVHPAFARRGIAHAILLACEEAMRTEKFTSAQMVATLPGELFYAAFGYTACERYEIPMANDLMLAVVRMSKQL